MHVWTHAHTHMHCTIDDASFMRRCRIHVWCMFTIYGHCIIQMTHAHARMMHLSHGSNVLLKHFPFASHAVAMKCNACARHAIGNFRARDEGEPFFLWCNDCYGTTFAGIVVAHDIEHPIICCECHELPADPRSQSKAMPDWRYWCHVCYERKITLIMFMVWIQHLMSQIKMMNLMMDLNLMMNFMSLQA